MPEKSSGQSFAGTVSALLAIATFAFGIYTYKQTSAAQLAKDEADAKRTAETRRIEATRPFLDKQLTLYTQVTKLAAKIPTYSGNDPIFQQAKLEFLELYSGEMGLVERTDVEQAMIAFKEALEARASKENLDSLAYRLSQACRKELAASWGIKAWLRDAPSEPDKPKP
jgi:hypothetical protein